MLFLKAFLFGAALPISEGLLPQTVQYWYNVTLDHFSFVNTQATFPLRYLVNDIHWDRAGPILYYTGNEGDITGFANNTGLLFEVAPSLGAMVVFAEHRYYGESLPFRGTEQNFAFLSVEQALADFSELLLHIRKAWKVPEEVACIAVGGSYGANLAYWWRARQPNLVAGALAASATPQKHLLRESNGFAAIWTEVYANVSQHCPRLVNAALQELQQKWQTGDGRAEALQMLNLCRSGSSLEFPDIYGWLTGGLESMVQYGYPYPTQVFNPMPGKAYEVACKAMLERMDKAPLEAVGAAVAVFYNYSGQAGDCFDLGKEEESQANPWDYQCCTEVYQPTPAKGLEGGDMLLPDSPNRTAYFQDCLARFGVTPRPDWEEMWLWGSQIRSLSNVFFTNGELDPWRAAAITELPTGGLERPNSVQIRFLQGAAHHLDLRASHPLDPASVTAVRREQVDFIRAWAADWRRSHVHIEDPAGNVSILI